MIYINFLAVVDKLKTNSFQRLSKKFRGYCNTTKTNDSSISVAAVKKKQLKALL